MSVRFCYLLLLRSLIFFHIRSLADPSSTRNVSDAKLALRQMKDVKKVLVSISGSLDDAIQTVTNSIVWNCHATGLASLPDDLLACSFETCLILDQEEKRARGLASCPCIGLQTLSPRCRPSPNSVEERVLRVFGRTIICPHVQMSKSERFVQRIGPGA